MFNIYRWNFRKILLGIIAVLVLLFIWFFSTHGFIVVDSLGERQIVSYSQTSNQLITELKSSNARRTLVASGEYTVQVPTRDGGIYLKKVTVPRFFSAVSIKTSDTTPLTSVVGRQTYVNLLMKKSKLESYDTDGSVLPVESTNISGSTDKRYVDTLISEMSQRVQLSTGIIAGIITVKAGYQPVTYNTGTGAYDYFPFVESTNKTPVLTPTPTGFTTFNKDTRKIHLYSLKEPDNVKTISLDIGDRISSQNNAALYSYSSGTAAVVTGSDFISRGDGKSDKSSHDLKIFNTHSKKEIKSLGLGDTPITLIVLSPDAKSIYIQSQQSGALFNTTTGRKIIGLPFAINQFKWLPDNNRFVFLTGERGIFYGDLQKGEARTLIPYSVARPTTLSFIDENKVYFTAYTAKTDGNDNPDAYVSDLDKSATPNSRQAFTTFPHQGRGFYVDYIDGKVTIQLTRYINGSKIFIDKSAQKAAKSYVRKVFKEDLPPISYSYVDLDIGFDTN